MHSLEKHFQLLAAMFKITRMIQYFMRSAGGFAIFSVVFLISSYVFIFYLTRTILSVSTAPYYTETSTVYTTTEWIPFVIMVYSLLFSVYFLTGSSQSKNSKGEYVAIVNGQEVMKASSLDELWKVLEARGIDLSRVNVTFRPKKDIELVS
jgi:hypothetical protein